jgi:hypothetical protein
MSDFSDEPLQTICEAAQVIACECPARVGDPFVQFGITTSFKGSLEGGSGFTCLGLLSSIEWYFQNEGMRV